jgi:DNA-binding CsgD family transcriptional regulator/PAS domain-containing protein
VHDVTRSTRCPFREEECASRAAAALGVIGYTGVAAVGLCLGRHRAVWATARTPGPAGAWVAATLRSGSTRTEPFPGFRRALDQAKDDPADVEPFLTVLAVDGTPLPAEARVRVVDRGSRGEPHLALVVLRDFADERVGMAPFEIAVHRSLLTGTGLEAAVTDSEMRITWASPALEARAGIGALLGLSLYEVTSVQERDVLVDLARQAAHRRHGRPPLSRALPTGRRASVTDRTHEPAVGGLVWWWHDSASGSGAGETPSGVEAAIQRFVDDLAWAGVDTNRASTRAVGAFAPEETLTPREREIIELLATGLRAPSIAERLFITPSTVRNHLSTAFRKLGVASQAEFFELSGHGGRAQRAGLTEQSGRAQRAGLSGPARPSSRSRSPRS